MTPDLARGSNDCLNENETAGFLHMNPNFCLSGKTALITGASSGLGKHFANCLGMAGAKVILAARRISLLDGVTAELHTHGISATAVSMDVTSEESIVSAIEKGRAISGGIDILVNNAGITSTRSVLDQDVLSWDAVLDTNLKGCFLVAREVARQLKEENRAGSIINIASIAGLRPAGHVAAYGASKAGLIHLTKSMALELARYRIRVNSIAPGYILTDLNRDFFSSEAGNALVKRIPQRTLGTPSDLDGALLLLASDASRYMTGSVIAVDGGHLVSSL